MSLPAMAGVAFTLAPKAGVKMPRKNSFGARTTRSNQGIDVGEELEMTGTQQAQRDATKGRIE